MSYEILKVAVSPAEGESTIKAYHCTTLTSRLLRLNAEGYLTVTNKRVIFYAFGSSYGGNSIFLSEVPIADVSGLSSYKGTYFSISHFLVAIAASFVASQIIGVITGVILGLLSFRDFQTVSVVTQVVPLIIFGAAFFVKRESLWRPVLASTSALLAFSTAGLSLFSNPLGAFSSGARSPNIGSWIAILVPIAIVYAIICLFWYARRETMSLSVGSKGGSSTPIAISGITGFGLYNSAALKALTAEPAVDAEKMIKELGAMITDIQAMGDLGIQKWASSHFDFGSTRGAR